MNDTEKRINKMIKKSEVILNAGKQTNEEWFCGLSTEQKAKFISRQMYYGLMEYKTDMTRFTTEYWNQWLKEAHRESE